MQALIAFVSVLSVLAACLYGWVVNIIHLAQAPEITGLVIARAVGIFFAPLGIVLGYV